MSKLEWQLANRHCPLPPPYTATAEPHQPGNQPPALINTQAHCGIYMLPEVFCVACVAVFVGVGCLLVLVCCLCWSGDPSWCCRRVVLVGLMVVGGGGAYAVLPQYVDT